jgi:hypothetical protein
MAARPSQQQAARQPQAAPFALSPAQASSEVIDFSQPAGAKLFKSATEKLTTTFDCEPENLHLFLVQLRDRSNTFDWNTIMLIPKGGDEENPKDLIESYGELSHADVRRHADSYVHTETRMAQDSYLLYLCIMASLSDKAQKKVHTRGSSFPFMIGNKGVGTLLLKVVIMASHLDTRATISAVRTKLSNLDKLMRDSESDVEKFNDQVIRLTEQLHARGETTTDILVNLFKGYKACKDAAFVEYIKYKESFYEEGGEVTYEQLMEWAGNKYRTKKENNEWCQKLTDEETIIALRAQLKSLSNKKGKQKSGDKAKDDDKQKTKGKKKKEAVPAWMKVAPKGGEPKSKTVEEKTYHWCETHESWVRHKPSECRGINFRGGKGNNDQDRKSNGGNNDNKKMKLKKALASVEDDSE